MRRTVVFALAALVILGVVASGVHAAAPEELQPGDPMVRITAPPALMVDKAKVLERLSKDVSSATGLDPASVTCYWQTFEEVNWNGKTVDSVPLFVDLYVPGWMSDETVARIMLSVAESLEKSTGVAKKWIFIQTHTGQPGRVLLEGKVQDFEKPADKAGKPQAPAKDPSPNKLVGTWTLISMTYRDEASGKETDLWGKDPIGFLTYTPGGRMSAVISAASRKVSAESADRASPEEQAVLFRSCFGYAGTYTLTDSGVIHHVEVASDPAWVGKDQTRYVRFEGKRLIVTGPPLQTVSDPNPRVLQLVWERVE